jgi:hypothetical protein
MMTQPPARQCPQQSQDGWHVDFLLQSAFTAWGFFTHAQADAWLELSTVAMDEGCLKVAPISTNHTVADDFPAAQNITPSGRSAVLLGQRQRDYFRVSEKLPAPTLEEPLCAV